MKEERKILRKMSLKDPNDKSVYQKKKFLTRKFSHGRITIEDWHKVINVSNGYLEIESNYSSQFDPDGRLSIIIRGGKWSLDDKKRTPKNAATFRFDDNETNERMINAVVDYVKKP